MSKDKKDELAEESVCDTCAIDPMGSYTGNPIDSDDEPVQDADDL